MATYTENYNLEKPAQSDLYNIGVFNENADKIDEALGDKAENQSLAPIESSATASRNYSVGQQFVYNGLLYEATSAIASGGTITPGSNCARTTVAEELSALNDSLTNVENVTSQFTLGSTITSNRFFVWKRGKHIFGYFRGSTSADGNDPVIFTLPNSYRPIGNLYTICVPNVWMTNSLGIVNLYTPDSGATWQIVFAAHAYAANAQYAFSFDWEIY